MGLEPWHAFLCGDGGMMPQASPRYIKIFAAFLKAGLQSEIEYRINILLRFVTDLIWYAAQIFMFEVIFLHVNRLGGLGHEEMRVFLGILFVVDALYMVFFSDNMDNFPDLVRKGDLDFLLVKPVNTQFIVSTQKITLSFLLNLLMGVGWLTWSLNRLPHLTFWQPVLLLVLLPCGTLIFYAMRFMFASLALVFTQSDSFMHVWFQFYKLGMRPDSIYQPWMRFFLMTLVPVSLIASVPSRLVLEPLHPGLAAWVVLVTVGLLYLSHRVWNVLIRHYVSASS